MPRPKVLPEHRQRAAGACAYCRTSKRKCTGIEPCTHCVRRGIAHQCHVTRKTGHTRNTQSPPPARDSSAQQPAQQLSASSNYRSPASSSSTTTGPTAPPSSANGQDLHRVPHAAVPGNPNVNGGDDNGNDDDDDDAITTQARMLLNLRGERVYIGGAASISFLQFIRDVVSKQIGPSSFTHNEKTDSMLETESADSNSNSLVSAVVDLDVQTKLSYSETYHAAVSGLLDVFSPSEVEGLLLASNDCGAPRISPCKRATIILIVAIGAQCQSPETAQHVARVYFRQAQQHAFAGMLEDPNVDMVRAFLLMAFYMLGACRRNSAFMYLGVATRAAVALGLHRLDSYTDMTSLRSQLRSKIWMSVCILDLLVSSILGRSPATATLRSDFNDKLDAPLRDYDDEDTRRLVSTYKILSIVNEAVDQLYENKNVSTSAIESYLDRIRQWRHEPVLSSSSDHHPKQGKGDQQLIHTIGAMHLSCVYYFAVTLVTRPVLVSTLTRATTTTAVGSANMKTPLSFSQQHRQHNQLASVCIDAAVHLVQSCVDTQRADMLLGNLCMVKAFVFAAGLILGFSMITTDEKRQNQHHHRRSSLSFSSTCHAPQANLTTASTAFHEAKHILSLLAVQSPQAGHYLEILTLLGATIEEERNKNLHQSGRGRPGSRVVVDSGSKKRRGSRAEEEVGGDVVNNHHHHRILAAVGRREDEEGEEYKVGEGGEQKDNNDDDGGMMTGVAAAAAAANGGAMFVGDEGDGGIGRNNNNNDNSNNGDLAMAGTAGLMGYEGSGQQQMNHIMGAGGGEVVMDDMGGGGGGELFFGWDTLDLSNWDSFPH